ncbi:hypothetical protein [Deinococcus kurensis]|uniref:hypothetical protein n=1 Tax=Deinococcus kurensis TaxID=2662757 RepID=UPI001F2809C2|nr:hypothetical protein [Deinococcus kurensis]
MADMLATLALARSVLTALPGFPPVVVRGQEADPGGEEGVVIDRVADTGVGMYGRAASTKRMQVTVFAQTAERALNLTSEVRAALAEAGFTYLGSRPALDGAGELSEYRR